MRIFLALTIAAALLAGCGGSPTSGTQSAPQEATKTASTPSHWQPVAANTWQWQLRGTVNTSYAVDVYDIDLVDTPVSTIQGLQASGIKVVCYFSAGSSENWRPDYSSFLASDMGNALDGWPGENWLDTTSANVRKIMQARLDLAVTKGCDGVEPDNVDGYSNNSGFPLTADTQLDYNRFLSTEAHNRGLAVALKNDVDQVATLEPSFDFAVNEQCHEMTECDAYSAFTNDNKPVFNAEYKSTYVDDADERQALCDDAQARNMRTLVLPLQLDDTFRYSCD
ncbi:MAG TPA: endo alpha-1,4 polygalactosaminidase [Burkholderiaceae bacterium]